KKSSFVRSSLFPSLRSLLTCLSSISSPFPNHPDSRIPTSREEIPALYICSLPSKLVRNTGLRSSTIDQFFLQYQIQLPLPATFHEKNPFRLLRIVTFDPYS